MLGTSMLRCKVACAAPDGIVGNTVHAAPTPEADATVHPTRDLLVRLGLRQVGVKELVKSDELRVEARTLKLLSLPPTIDKPDGQFAIVTP
jgi:alkyl sulfatase BDS1-like metallo-beta-lactamase superfamily hydrolase